MVKAINVLVIESVKNDSVENQLRQYCPMVNVIGAVSNVSDACEFIRRDCPDLVFIEAELEGESGMELYNFFPFPPFDVVIVASDQNYALQGIKFGCMDYLLKPLDYQELQVAVYKKIRILSGLAERRQNHKYQSQTQARLGRKIAVPSNSGYDLVDIDGIIMAKAEGNYTRIFSVEDQLLCSKTLGEIEPLLPAETFFRTHKTYLINFDKVVKYNRTDNQILLRGGCKAELAVRRKDDFIAFIRGNAFSKDLNVN